MFLRKTGFSYGGGASDRWNMNIWFMCGFRFGIKEIEEVMIQMWFPIDMKEGEFGWIEVVNNVNGLFVTHQL